MDNMKFIKVTNDNFDELKVLQTKYKSEIGEEEPTYENFLNFPKFKYILITKFLKLYRYYSTLS